MDLTLSGEIAKHLLTMTKKDGKLAQALAQQFMEHVEPSAIASYLLSFNVAVDLLAARIMKNPEKTIQELQDLPAVNGEAIGRSRRGRPGRQPSRPGRKSGQLTVGIFGVGTRRRKRRRMTTAQIAEIKQEVISFLRKKPWSTRKQIAEAVSFPSVAAYNRIMSELRSSKEIIAQGEKSKTLYAVSGAKKGTATGGSSKEKKTVKTGKKPKAAKRARSVKNTKKTVQKKQAKAAPKKVLKPHSKSEETAKPSTETAE